MRGSGARAVILLALLHPAPSGAASHGQSSSNRYQEWLESDAAYLATDREKEVFENLTTDEDRERFIESFWLARDPTPGTTRNEVREEHQKRVAETNRLFRGSGLPGWKTERGRIYILLGPPRERRTYDHASEVWPIELWFYQVSDRNLPPFFYLLFYRRSGTGPYRLWDPIGEGPGALLTQYAGAGGYLERARAYRVFEAIDTDLYQAVRSPVPGESPSSSQFSYQKILAVLEDYPNQSLNPETARRYRPGEGIVEADYLFKKLEVAPLIALLPSDNGVFVHYALEIAPEDLFYAQYRETFYTVFDVEVEVTTREGTIVLQLTNRHEIEVPEAQWEVLGRRPLSLQGRFPVVAGDFQLRLLVRSRTGRVYDAVVRDLVVPETLEVSDLYPANSFTGSASTGHELAFEIADAFALPNPRSLFRPGGNLRAFWVLGPGAWDALGPELTLHGTLRLGGETAHELERRFQRPSSDRAQLLALDVSLGAAPPGEYLLELALGPLNRSLPVRIEAGAPLPSPIVNSSPEVPASDGHWNVERARQYRALGQNLPALGELENAVERNPDLELARLQLGVLALGLDQPERALEGLVPGLMRLPFHYELLTLAGFACERLGRLDEAAAYYERARVNAKADEKLLRALAGVYQKQGAHEKAEALLKELKN